MKTWLKTALGVTMTVAQAGACIGIGIGVGLLIFEAIR